MVPREKDAYRSCGKAGGTHPNQRAEFSRLMKKKRESEGESCRHPKQGSKEPRVGETRKRTLLTADSTTRRLSERARPEVREEPPESYLESLCLH